MKGTGSCYAQAVVVAVVVVRYDDVVCKRALHRAKDAPYHTHTHKKKKKRKDTFVITKTYKKKNNEKGKKDTCSDEPVTHVDAKPCVINKEISAD